MIRTDLNKMTKVQLITFAQANNIPIDEKGKKKDIIGVIDNNWDNIPDVEFLPFNGVVAVNKDGEIFARTPSGTEILFQKIERYYELQNEIDKYEIDKYEIDKYEIDDDSKEYKEYDKAIDEYRKLGRELRRKKISTSVYFQFIKSKFDIEKQMNIAEKIQKINKFMESAELLDQEGLYEELARQITILIKQEEMQACGINKFVKRNLITEMKDWTKERRTIRFKLLNEFPRIVPEDKVKFIKSIKDKNIFDSFHILYVDLVNEKFKSNKKKIKEKDPIVFGSFNGDHDKLYYITDWVDETCDLTLNKIIENANIDVSELPELTDEYLKSIMDGVKSRHERLKRTNTSNYNDLMEEEEREVAMRKINAEKQTIISSNDESLSWFKRIIKRIFK